MFEKSSFDYIIVYPNPFAPELTYSRYRIFSQRIMGIYATLMLETKFLKILTTGKVRTQMLPTGNIRARAESFVTFFITWNFLAKLGRLVGNYAIRR